MLGAHVLWEGLQSVTAHPVGWVAWGARGTCVGVVWCGWVGGGEMVLDGCVGDGDVMQGDVRGCTGSAAEVWQELTGRVV